MTVYELFHKTSIEDITKRLERRCKNPIGELEVYLNQIWELTPVNNEDYVVTEVRDFAKTKGLFEYSEVFAFNKNEPNERIEIYSNTWENVLGFNIEERCLTYISPEDLTADIIDEML